MSDAWKITEETPLGDEWEVSGEENAAPEAEEDAAPSKPLDIGSVIQNTLKSVADWYQAQPSFVDKSREVDRQRAEMTARGERVTPVNDPGANLAREVGLGFAGPGAAASSKLRTKAPTQGELESGVTAARTAASESPKPKMTNANAEADAMQARAQRGKMIEDAITRAKQNKSGGFDNAIRAQFKRLWSEANGDASLGFSPDELAAISKVAEGGLIRNGLSALGTLSPTAGRMSAALWGTGAASSAFVPGALPAVAAGAAATMGARGGANALAGRAARRAGDVVRSGDRGMNARTYQDLANSIKDINSKVEDVIKRNKGTVPTPEEKLYAEYRPLRDERNRIFREMRATPRM